MRGKEKTMCAKGKYAKQTNVGWHDDEDLLLQCTKNN